MSVYTHGYRVWSKEDEELLIEVRNLHPRKSWRELEHVYGRRVPRSRYRSRNALCTKWKALCQVASASKASEDSLL